MTILVTGAAGFIGYHLCQQLCQRGEEVLGIDNLNDYYDVTLKQARLKQLQPHANFSFLSIDIANQNDMESLFARRAFDIVVNLAAQAGVRYSIENPQAYIQSNLVGFSHLLESCRQQKQRHQRPVTHLVFASSSSVYGANGHFPFSEHDNVDHPKSLYAATKKANELMAHTYASLYQLPCTGLRFFTVYGPWGRPDMALFKFTHAILNEEPITVYRDGEMYRDFTYVDDIVAGICQVIDHPAETNPDWDNTKPDAATSYAPYRLYNIGCGQPILLNDMIQHLENALGKTAKRHNLPMQAGDVLKTHADITLLEKTLHYRCHTPLQIGIQRFVNWYLEYYNSTTKQTTILTPLQN